MPIASTVSIAFCCIVDVDFTLKQPEEVVEEKKKKRGLGIE